MSRIRSHIFYSVLRFLFIWLSGFGLMTLSRSRSKVVYPLPNFVGIVREIFIQISLV